MMNYDPFPVRRGGAVTLDRSSVCNSRLGYLLLPSFSRKLTKFVINYFTDFTAFLSTGRWEIQVEQLYVQ